MKNLYIAKNSMIATMILLMSLSASKENSITTNNNNKILKKSNLINNVKSDDFTNFLDDNIDLSVLIDNRADKIVRDYMDTVQNRVFDLSNNKNGFNHGKSLLERFGSAAPTTKGGYAYCLWGERKSLESAISALGLNINALPEINACPSMIHTMLQENPESSFYGKIWEDKTEFLNAREKFANENVVKWQKSLKKAPNKDEITQKLEEYKSKFNKTNTAATDIRPGSIYSTKAHAEMFLGRGKIVDKKFVADETGKFFRAGFNKEMIREVDFHNGQTRDVFIGNTYELMIKKLKEQTEQIKHMSRDSLLSNAYANGISENKNYLKNLSDNELKVMLLEKLLGTKLNTMNKNTISLIQFQKSRDK